MAYSTLGCFVYVFMCMHIYIWYLCTCVCGSEVNIECLLQLPSSIHIFFLRQGISLNLEHINWLSLLAGKPQKFPLFLPSQHLKTMW